MSVHGINKQTRLLQQHAASGIVRENGSHRRLSLDISVSGAFRSYGYCANKSHCLRCRLEPVVTEVFENTMWCPPNGCTEKVGVCRVGCTHTTKRRPHTGDRIYSTINHQ